MKNLFNLRFFVTMLLLIFSISVAKAITITPTVVEISPAKKVVNLTFTNDTARDINLQSSILLWTQTNGKDTYVPSKDIVIVPAVVTVPAGKSQSFRVSKLAFDNADLEKSYRLYLEDVTPDFIDPKAKDSGVTFKFNQNLPVYYSTAKPKANKAFKATICPSDNKQQTCVRVDNSEATRVTVQNISFKATSGKKQDDVDAGVVGTVLATSFKEFRFSTPAIAAKDIVIKTSFGEVSLPVK
jgi:fimbrial chaperone protein